MRIALIQSAPRGGLLHYAAQLGDGLVQRGHDVVLITAREHELQGRPSGVSIRAVLPAAAPRSAAPRHGLGYLARRVGVGLRLLSAGTLTVREVRRGSFDAVLLLDDVNIALAALPMLVLTGLPSPPLLAAVCHEPRPRNRWSGEEVYVQRRTLLKVLGHLYRRLDLVLVHGERSQAEFAAAWPGATAAVIPHGHGGMLAPRPLPPAAEERILFFGDWRRSKGLPELMQAFDRLRERRPQAQLTIAGMPYPDAEPDRVRSWARRHGRHVTLLDRYVPIEELEDLFGSARVVATPYIAGSQSGVLHLAMSFGKAVVTSDVGELSGTVIDGETGLVVPAGDVEALAEALARVLDDRELAEALGRRAREWMLSHVAWDVVAARLESELAAAAGPSNGRAP